MIDEDAVVPMPDHPSRWSKCCLCGGHAEVMFQRTRCATVDCRNYCPELAHEVYLHERRMAEWSVWKAS